jgi:probable rRNA maturation factor
MTHRIHVRYRRPYARFAGVIRRAARAALRHEIDSPAELTLVLTDADGIRELNRRFSGQDQATDVLSFPGCVPDPETGRAYLGDVIIAFPVAQTQAQAAGIAVNDEIALLAVHGVLHLLGYDHATAAEKHQMWSIQTAILAAMDTGTANAHVGRQREP